MRFAAASCRLLRSIAEVSSKTGREYGGQRQGRGAVGIVGCCEAALADQLLEKEASASTRRFLAKANMYL